MSGYDINTMYPIGALWPINPQTVIPYQTLHMNHCTAWAICTAGETLYVAPCVYDCGHADMHATLGGERWNDDVQGR